MFMCFLFIVFFFVSQLCWVEGLSGSRQPRGGSDFTLVLKADKHCNTLSVAIPEAPLDLRALDQARKKSEPILGRGCDEALFSEKKGFSLKRGEAIQWMGALVRISTGKAIPWRGPGRTLKTEKLLSSSPSRKSTLKKSTNPNSGVRIFSGRAGVFHMKGFGPKSSVCPLKPGKSNSFGGISRDLAGISRRRPKSLRKNKFVFNFGPYLKSQC